MIIIVGLRSLSIPGMIAIVGLTCFNVAGVTVTCFNVAGMTRIVGLICINLAGVMKITGLDILGRKLKGMIRWACVG